MSDGNELPVSMTRAQEIALRQKWQRNREQQLWDLSIATLSIASGSADLPFAPNGWSEPRWRAAVRQYVANERAKSATQF
jgi:hypothetical protein